MQITLYIAVKQPDDENGSTTVTFPLTLKEPRTLVPSNSFRPSYFSNAEFDPIQEVLASKAEIFDRNATCRDGRYGGLKPEFVEALIWRHHLGTGEITQTDGALTDVIHERGNERDDAGHVVAASLGGKMVDFNLFPQYVLINRGHRGIVNHSHFYVWRYIEVQIGCWVLLIPENKRPRVKFQASFEYSDATKPDRPSMVYYKLVFICDDDDSSSDSSDDDGSDATANTLQSAFRNAEIFSYETLQEGKEVTKNAIATIFSRVPGGRRQSLLIDFFVRVLREMGVTVEEPAKSKPRNPSSSPSNTYRVYRYRPVSFWDFVPVVGSVKSTFEGVQDVFDGNALSAVGNLTLGIGGLALDVVTLGAASSAIKGATKGGVIVAGKILAQEGTKVAAKSYAVSGGSKLVRNKIGDRPPDYRRNF